MFYKRLLIEKYQVRKELFILILAAAVAGHASGQETLRERLRGRTRERLERRGDLITGEDYEGINTGVDFTKPFARTEFEYQYQQVTSNNEASFFTFRQYAPYRLNNGWVISGRIEIPLIYTDIPSRDNPNGDYELGAGDLATQLLLIQPPRGRWSFVSGARFLWPTASQDQMGTGKYVAGPTIGAVYHPKNWNMGGFLGVLLTDLFDYAGKDNRKDVHELSVQTIINYNFEAWDDFWFVTLAPEIRINWEQDNDVFLPCKISIGKLLTDNSTFSVGFSAPLVNDYDLYDWQMGFSFSRFF
ncbi:MAG: hypothetical protein ACYSTT_19300 [Planctomycetota bacterium]|jgi:hypothetical protein